MKINAQRERSGLRRSPWPPLRSPRRERFVDPLIADFDRDEADVVGDGLVPDESQHGVHEAVHDLPGGLVHQLLQRFFHALDAEFLACGVVRLEQAVGEENNRSPSFSRQTPAV